MVLLIAIAGAASAVYGLRRHEANNDTAHDTEHLRGWRIAATVSLVCMIAYAVWLTITGNLL